MGELKRWTVTSGHMGWKAYQHKDGNWCRYDDAADEIARITQRSRTNEQLLDAIRNRESAELEALAELDERNAELRALRRELYKVTARGFRRAQSAFSRSSTWPIKYGRRAARLADYYERRARECV